MGIQMSKFISIFLNGLSLEVDYPYESYLNYYSIRWTKMETELSTSLRC